MSAFAIIGKQTPVSGANKTIGNLIGAATVVPRLYEFTISALGAPADNVLIYTLQRTTAADGTGTTLTPRSVQLSSGIATEIAPISTYKNNFSAEPAYAANKELWGPQGINQRAAYRWVAYQADAELGIPAIALQGIGCAVQSPAYTGEADWSVFFRE
jgi:hypothetical protein